MAAVANETVTLLLPSVIENPHHFLGDLDQSRSKFILWVLTVIVCPVISLLGLVGNAFSLIILKRHGLHKCSNISLFSLAISDVTFLVGANINALCRKFHDLGRVKGFALPYTLALLVYVIHNIADVMDWVGSLVSFTLPILITVERLVAVFLPMKFPQIITARRTRTAVTFIFVFWYSLIIHTRLWFTFVYTSNNPYNISVGIMERSAIFIEQQAASDVIQALIIYIGFLMPLPLVVTGCVCIGVKVKLAAAKRGKMTSSVPQDEAGQKLPALSRTTKTLISVCGVYAVACFFTALPQHMPQFLVYTLFSDAPHPTALVVYQSINVVLAINSSSNFLIYVITNRKFRDTQKEILASCFCSYRE